MTPLSSAKILAAYGGFEMSLNHLVAVYFKFCNILVKKKIIKKTIKTKH